MSDCHFQASVVQTKWVRGREWCPHFWFIGPPSFLLPGPCLAQRDTLYKFIAKIITYYFHCIYGSENRYFIQMVPEIFLILKTFPLTYHWLLWPYCLLVPIMNLSLPARPWPCLLSIYLCSILMAPTHVKPSSAQSIDSSHSHTFISTHVLSFLSDSPLLGSFSTLLKQFFIAPYVSFKGWLLKQLGIIFLNLPSYSPHI